MDSLLVTSYSRLSHHTLTTSGLTFSVPLQEDFTLTGTMSWTTTDLCLSEIGVNEADQKAFIRIGGTVSEISLGGTSSGLFIPGSGSGSIQSNFFSNNSSGNGSFTVGVSNTASGSAASAFGDDTNATGDNSFSIGTLTTATGSNSFSSGTLTTASGNNSFSSGNVTVASGDSSYSGGKFASASHYAEWSRSSGVLGQYGIVSFYGSTSNATPTELFLDNSSLRFTILPDSVYSVEVMAVAKDATTGDAKEWTGSGFLIKNIAGTTTAIGATTLTNTNSDPGLAGITLVMTANNANDAIQFEATGLGGNTINWFIKMEYTMLGNR